MSSSTSLRYSSNAENKSDVKNVCQDAPVRRLVLYKKKEITSKEHETTLKSLVDSISQLIKCSTNEGFRRRCFESVGVDNRRDFEQVLWKNVVHIANNKLGLTDIKVSSNNEAEQSEINDENLEADGLEFF